MKIKTLFLLLVIIFGTVFSLEAQGVQQNSTAAIFSAFRLYKDVDVYSINVPTVVEVPLTDDFIERFDFAVLNKANNSFEPYFFKKETIVNEVPVIVNTVPPNNTASKMTDKNVRTYSDFSLPEDIKGEVQINLSSAGPITSSALTVLLDRNVALPNSVEIRASVDGQSRIVAINKMNRHTINFPQTTSDSWQIKLTYGQPLRISELRLIQDNIQKTSTHAIRFLAQPSSSYRIYLDPDRRANAIVAGESGNLISAQDVLVVPPVPSQSNPEYVIADLDKDNIPDIMDNCVSVSNTDQKDINNNERGDVCDDFDQDRIINSQDNCPDNPNRNQRDEDGDGIGDVCDDEESRITERHYWIPWAGIGFAAVVLITLLALTARATYDTKQGDDKG